MEQTHLVHPSAFCWNPSCTDYGQVNRGNIRRFGRTQAGTQRYQCRTCDSTFVETIGTVFYGRHHTQETILECLALLAERNSLAAIHRVKGIKEETVMDWLRLAADHVERIAPLHRKIAVGRRVIGHRMREPPDHLEIIVAPTGELRDGVLGEKFGRTAFGRRLPSDRLSAIFTELE